ncbi:MAG: hypothetical protein DMF97_18540 [Acidobacteria bacterium]|nr:MAG: hypothetical protein DMF97_18540 [Acidobacteriota bacterium]
MFPEIQVEHGLHIDVEEFFETRLIEFLAKALNFLRIRCGSKAFSKFEKGLLLLLFCLEPFFDEFNQHSVGA